MKTTKMNNMLFEYKIQLRYPDFDTQKFVNHSKICTYVESTYISFLIDYIGTGWDFGKMPILLKKENTEYFRPITPHSAPICILKITDLRNKGIALNIEIVEGRDRSKVYTRAERTLIHVDLAAVKPMEFLPDVFEKLNLYFALK
jgi:acyl-CoA thioesterase FadM